MPTGTTFWDFLLICFSWFGSKFSRITNSLVGTFSILGASSIMSARTACYFTLAGSIVGYIRAQWISNTVDQAKDIVATQTKIRDQTILPSIPGDKP